MTRIQFWGDLAGTGFGTVTGDLGAALLAGGHDVRFVSQNDLGERMDEPFTTWENDGRIFHVDRSMVDAGAAEEYGLNSLALTPAAILRLIRGELWSDGWRPDAAIILGDFLNVRKFVMNDEHTIASFTALPTYHYVPIEGMDLPPAWAPMWNVIHPIAMSEFGADQIERVTGTRPPVVYHGVDTTQFRPATPERPIYMEMAKGTTKLRSKAECRRFLSIPQNVRIVFRADRLMPRKRYASLLRSMAPVMATRPDVFLLMHCRNQDEGSIGGIYDLRSKYHESIAKRMQITGFHDQVGGATRDMLTVLYNAADVYASNSAEGFGLTIAEAMACGTPAVGMHYSAVPEVIGEGGMTVPPKHLDDNEYDHLWATVDETKFGEAVATLLDNDVLRKSLGRKAVEHVRASFSWATAARQFGELLTERAQVAA